MTRRELARAFVEEFAERLTYGGGSQCRLRIGGEYLDAIDGWNGYDTAIDRVTDQLLAAMPDTLRQVEP